MIIGLRQAESESKIRNQIGYNNDIKIATKDSNDENIKLKKLSNTNNHHSNGICHKINNNEA